MLHIDFEKRSKLRVLCLGAHADDIEIGCGGTVLKLLRQAHESSVHWVVFAGKGSRGAEARKSADQFLAGAAERHVVVKEYQDGFFPYQGGEIKGFFEELKRTVDPDVIFTHTRGDLHQDHRLINELTWNTWRNHFILEYEILKYDGDLGNPNFYVELDPEVCQTKIETIWNCFASQRDKHWFSKESLAAMHSIRGVECRARASCAEGFYCRKLVF